jgi:hypothetical protein
MRSFGPWAGAPRCRRSPTESRAPARPTDALRSPPVRYGQVPATQYSLTSLTQISSQSTAQQYGSAEHTSSAHVLHDSFSLLPGSQTGCEHVPPPPPLLLPPLLPPLLLPPPPPHDSPQYLGTSLTQMPSQAFVQQYWSLVHTSSAHVLHVSVRGVPSEQTEWTHDPPLPPELPPLLEPPDPPPLEPPLLPPELPPLLPPLDPPLLPPELPPLEPPLLPPELPPLEPPLLEPLPLPLSAAPLGVPQPVGPSYPTPAVHRYEPPQLPLLPDVTS